MLLSPFLPSLRITPIFLAVAALLWLAPTAKAQEGTPQWATPWQRTLMEWVQSLSLEDVTIAEKPYDFTRLDPAETRRNRYLITTSGPTLSYATAAMRLPPESFLWSGIWHPEKELVQKFLKGQAGVEQGQIWTPTHPSMACTLGWLYQRERPWNPYYHDPALARRSAVIATLSLTLLHASIHERNVSEPGAIPRPHTGIQGFSLTFNAFAHTQVAQALPEPVREAWAEGLRWFAELLAATPPNGPENMRLSTPVGIFYTGIALNDDSLKAKARRAMHDLLASEYSLAGYIRDGGVPDGSYYGISQHRLAEFWAISQDARVLDVLRNGYRLKLYLTLPEPGGGTVSPSHFNARCQDGFDYDQYQGREVMLLPTIPDAAWFARRNWPEDLTPEKLAKDLERYHAGHANRVPTAGPWGIGRGTENQPHGWGRVLTLPYLIYHGSDEAEIERLIREASPPVLTSQRYTERFGGEFCVVRRPAYAAIFYTGPAISSDKGATNYHGILQGEGGYHMGFGGGGLSAFWTPEAGSLILGRLNSKEAYERKKKVGRNQQFDTPGWQDWLTNQIVGETQEGKIVTSGRTPLARNRLSADDNELEIQGKLPRQSARQGDLLPTDLTYQRRYRFDDHEITCEVELSTEQPSGLRTLYEALPLVIATGREPQGPVRLVLEDHEGNQFEPDAAKATPEEARFEKITAITATRNKGTLRIRFPKPVSVSLESEPNRSRQFTTVDGRSLLIAFPQLPAPGAPARLVYHLTPSPVQPC